MQISKTADARIYSLFSEQDAKLGTTVQRGTGVTVTNLGVVTATVGEIFELAHVAGHKPVRSGHIGNWGEIWRGRVGLVDYNRYICRDFEMGAPLLHTHTAIENEERSDGDSIYLPGGVVEDGRYHRLPLFERANGTFRPLPADSSRCCAYVYVQVDGAFISLPRARFPECGNNFDDASTIPDRLLSNEALLREYLGAAVRGAIASPNPNSRLEEVLGGSVDTRGRRGAAPIIVDGVFVCEETSYRSVEALVDAAVECLKDGSVGRLPQLVRDDGDFRPMLGAAFVIMLVALFDNEDVSPSEGRLHLHWGAVSMSGYPPKSLGYFSRRSTRKTLRNIAAALSGAAGPSRHVRFGLLPAPILSLLPPREFERDVTLMQELFERVLNGTVAPGADPNVAQAEIDAVTDRWLDEARRTASDYFLRRFAVARTVQNESSVLPADGQPAELGAMANLTMQQSSMLLGSLLTSGARSA